MESESFMYSKISDSVAQFVPQDKYMLVFKTWGRPYPIGCDKQAHVTA